MEEIIITRTCRECGIPKPLEELRSHKNKKDGKLSLCKICFNKQMKIYRDINKDKYIKGTKEFRLGYEAKLTRGRAKAKEYYYLVSRGSDSAKTIAKRYNHRAISNLDSSYVSKILREKKGESPILGADDIPEELINLKRATMVLRRKLKEK